MPAPLRLLPALALLATPSLAAAADLVDGVLIDDHFPASIQIVAPKADHNVISVGVDAATASYVITVNGRIAEVPQKGAGGPILTIRCRGGAGGSDQVTASGAVQVLGMWFGGHNLITATGGALVYPDLFGDYDTIDATGGHAYYDIWGGAHDVLKGDTTQLYPNALCNPTAIPGVFTAGGTGIMSLYIVSPRAGGNTVATSIDAAAKTLTVTENGASVTLSTVGLLPSYNYLGSWSGGDTFTGIGSGFSLYGSGNRVAFHDALALATIWGDGNAIAGTRAGGTAYVHGTDAISGMTVVDSGPAPAVATVYASGTTTGGTSTGVGGTTGGGATGGSTATGGGAGGGGGTGAATATAGATGGGGGGCGLGGALGLLAMAAALHVRRREPRCAPSARR